MQRSAPCIVMARQWTRVGAVAHEVARGTTTSAAPASRAARRVASRAWRLPWMSLRIAIGGVAGPSGWRAVRGYDSRVRRPRQRPARWLPAEPARRAAALAAVAAVGRRAASWRCCAGGCGARASRTSSRARLTDWFDPGRAGAQPRLPRGASGRWPSSACRWPPPRRSASPCSAAAGARAWCAWRAGGRGGRGSSSASGCRWPRSLVALPLSSARYAWGRDYGIVTQGVAGLAARPGQGPRHRRSVIAALVGRGRGGGDRPAAADVVGGARGGRSAVFVVPDVAAVAAHPRAALPAHRAAARPGAVGPDPRRWPTAPG